MASAPDELYRSDFYAWTREQAAALRRLAETRPNVEIDWPHLVEEIEDLGKAELRAAASQLRRIIEHCLKLEHAAASEPRRGWLNSIDDARAQLSDRLTANLRADVEPELPRLYRQVLKRVRRDLEAYGEAATLPPECPYRLEQLIDEDWYPEPRRGSGASEAT